jgi:hypothetical protein
MVSDFSVRRQRESRPARQTGKKLAKKERALLNRCTMKSKTLLSIVVAGSFALSSVSFAAGVKTYQVTGPIIEMNDTMIAVMKGKDRWEIARDSSAKVTGDLKVGGKVTITYTMAATEVEAKADKAADKAAAKPAPKKP